MPAQIHTTFTTASGALCFGTLQNIWSGASKPLSKEIPQDERKTTFSLPAKKGTWNVFRLLDAEGHIPCAWFACHNSVDAEVEVDRIIRAAGSTRDEDKVKGKEGGILVFGPFDWGGYGLSAGEARRAAREINEVVTDPVDKSAAVGLSDWAQAKSATKAWSRKIPADRESTDSAVWMYIPSAHNRFGRFGLDDARTAVQSFLFFTWDANKFTRTFFPGCETTLRRHENEKRAELHDRYIREGVDHFLGIDWLNQQDKVKPARNEPVTKKRKTSRKSDSTLVLLGPYDQSEHILSQEDIRVLRVQSGYQGPPPDWYELRRQQERGIMIGRSTLPLMDNFRDHSRDLLNELVLAFLDHALVPHLASGKCTTPDELAAVLFPGIENPDDYKSPDNIAYQRFSGFTDILYGVDGAVALEKMVEFLNARLPKARQIGADDERIKAMLRVVVYLLSEIFYVAHDCAVGQGRDRIVPADMRKGLYHARWFWGHLKFSQVLWKGR